MKIEKLIAKLRSMDYKSKRTKTCPRRYLIIACALDKKGNAIAIKTNTYTCSHPLQKHFATMVGKPDAIFLHAEIAALIAAKNKSVHKLLVARIDNYGNPAPAKPCPICQKAIKAFGVKEVEYT